MLWGLFLSAAVCVCGVGCDMVAHSLPMSGVKRQVGFSEAVENVQLCRERQGRRGEVWKTGEVGWLLYGVWLCGGVVKCVGGEVLCDV
ncbi:hypothetical protein CUROG_09035 [Corynebacterium urogenitale]|uniref:Uncharacterized protein n=1 Tax=Corynebacterium urogenitale TaxID=2487892 RepID=A0A5J6ZA55_9CORY|nr:hypothetical protein CUROG_09035 [Corynebacterium urogenitale]